MPVQTITQWVFSDEFKVLCERRRTLNAYMIEDKDDEQAVSLMWDALADEYEKCGYGVNADLCRKKSAYWAEIYAGYRPAPPGAITPHVSAPDTGERE